MSKPVSSISTAFAASVIKQTESGIDNSEFLLVEVPQDRKKTAAKGIHDLFTVFPYKTHTFQFIKVDDSGKMTAPARAYSDPNTALTQALDYSNRGYDVYFMVNEGDGKVHEGKRVCRSQANVTELSKFFIDTDNCPVEKVRSYLKDVGLIPHLVIESSPGRFHFYFSFSPVDLSPAHIERWKAVQHILHRLGDPTILNPSKTLGTDNTMHDYSKVLRVPGFLHVKKKHLSQTVEQNEIPLYDFEDFFLQTNAQSFLDQHSDSATTDSHVPSLDADTMYEAGERFAALQGLSMFLANQTQTARSEHLNTFTNFIRTRLNNDDSTYLHNDQLTDKSKQLFNSAFSKIQREEKTKIEQIHSTLDKPQTDPWSLPDSFYLNAPNGFGDIVKQVMNASLYPSAAVAFGTFLTGLSILKARTHLIPGGSSPALYTLNVAISGYGKGDPMTLLQNTFNHYGLGKLIENEIRSDRGIYLHLKANDGLGFFLLDEVAPLFRAIQKEEAATHHANIAKALLQLYSQGAMKGVSFGKIQKKDDKVIVIDNPMIALCAFTVPHEFNTLFNSDSVAKGLFQRFIPIVSDIVEIPKNSKADKHAVIKSPLFSAFLGAQELDGAGNSIPPLQSGVRTRMKYTPEALERFDAISAHYRSIMIACARDPEREHMAGLYSRLAEQMERMASVLSEDEINLETLEYAISFIESRHKATLATCGMSVLAGAALGSIRKEKAVLDALARECQDRDVTTVPKRDVYMRVRRYFSSSYEFTKTLADLEETGQISITFKTGKNGNAIKNSYMITFAKVI